MISPQKPVNSGAVELPIGKGSQGVWSDGFNPRSQSISLQGLKSLVHIACKAMILLIAA